MDAIERLEPIVEVAIRLSVRPSGVIAASNQRAMDNNPEYQSDRSAEDR
jgi:hypothetical protein